MRNSCTCLFVFLAGLFIFTLPTASMVSALNRFSVATGNWNSTATWSATSGGAPGATAPVAGDNATIEGGFTVTTTAATACTNLTISSGSTLSVGAFAITISGTTAVTGTIIHTSTTGTKQYTGLVTINAGGNWNNSGNSAIQLRGGITNSGTFNAGSGVYTFQTNAQALTGTLSIPNVTVTGVTLTNNGTLSCSGSLAGTGGLTNAATGILHLDFTGTVGITTLTATAVGNVVDYGFAGTQTIKVVTYHHLNLSNSGVKTFAVTTVNGNLTLSGSAAVTTGAALVIGGNLIIGDGTTFTAAGFNLTVTGTTTTGSGTSGNLTISSVTGTKIFTGLLTNSAGATWNNSINSAVTFRGGITNNGTFTAGTGVYTFSTNSQALSGILSIPSITVTGITLTNNGTLTCVTALAGTGGLTNAATGNLHIDFTGAVGITTLTATAIGNMVDYGYAGAQTVKATTYDDLTVSGSGIKTTTGVTVNAILSMEETATVSAAPTYGGAATLQYNTATARIAGVEWLNTFAASGGINILNTGVITLNAAKVLNSGVDLSIGTGSTLSTSASNYSLTIGGDFTNNGTFTGGSSTVTFNGGVAQSILGNSALTFNNLVLNNTLGLTIGGSVNAIVNGTLTFTNGRINTTTNTLVMGNAASVSGAGAGKYVNGNLQKGIAAATATKTFEVGDATSYGPVQMNFTGTTNGTGSITAKCTAGNHPNIASSNIDPALCVNEYWTLVNSGVTGFTTYDATFTFTSSDILPGADYTSFIVGRYLTGAWNYPTVGTLTSTSTQATGLSAFGDFQVGESSAAPSPCLYGDNGSTPAVSNVMPCISFPTHPVTVSTTMTAHQYFTMNVIKGISYSVYTCNTTSPPSQLKIIVYKEGAPSDPYLAFSYSNSGNTCATNANNVFVSFTPSFSGQVRVLINKRSDCTSTTPTGLTLMVDANSGSNTQDNELVAGTDSWTGHIYDGTNAGVAYNGNFLNYLGYYAQTETFSETFGGDTYCFSSVNSNGVVRAAVYTDGFSVRYRMSSTRKGLYIADMGSDDGERLAVDGSLIFNNWTDQSFVSRPRVLFSLTGSSSLVFDYYENTGQNQVVFQNLTLVLSNSLSTNLTQNVCLGNSGSAISGDIYGTLPTGITLSGTGYQWTYSTTPSGTRTAITGATGATYTPNTAAAPFNVAGTYYIYRNAVLSSANNIAPNPYIATNESNAATLTVNPTNPVSISIIANPAGGICPGTSVTFTAVPVNGGTSPAYQWKKNGTNVGTSSTTYTDAGLISGDAITCVLTSNISCASGNPATSNQLVTVINPPPVSPVSAASNPSSIYSNYSGTISLSVTGGGGATGDVLRWYAGGCGTGAPIGSGNPLVIAPPFTNTTYYARWENGTCYSGCASAQVTIVDVFRSKSSGNWNDLTTWEVFTNDGSTWIAATHMPTATDGTITIRSPHTVTVVSATGSINVDEVTVDAGAKLVVNINPSGYWFNIINGPGVDLTVNGTMEYQDDIVQLLNGAQMAVGSGGRYQANLNYAGNYPITIPTATWDPNSTCEVLSSNQFVPGGGLTQNFGNFTWNYPGQTATLNLAGALQTIAGNFTVSSTGTGQLQLTNTTNLTLTIGNDLILQNGTVDFSNGAAATKIINLGGNYTQTGGTFSNSNSNPLTINFKGSGKTFTQSAGTLTSTNINWNVNTGASLALQNNLPVAATKTCQVNGSLDCGISTNVNGAGSFTLASGGTLILGSPGGISLSGATGNVQTTVRSFSTGGNYIYDGSALQVTGSGLPSLVNNLGIDNLNGVNLSGSSGVNGTLTLSHGAFSLGPNSFIFQNSNTPVVKTSGTITTDPASNLTFGTPGNTAGAAFTLPAGLFTVSPVISNLTLNRVNPLTWNNQSLSISGILLCNGSLNTNNQLTLLSTAAQTALIDGSGTGQVSGNVAMQRFIPSSFGYKYFSSPFTSATVGQFSGYVDLNATFPTFYRYDETKSDKWWITYTNPSGLLVPTQAYAANFGTTKLPVTVSLNGPVNDGNQSTATLYNHNYPYTLGFNLVGNPYPSPVDWNLSSGWVRTNIDNAIYFFNAGDSSQYTGKYSSYINGVSSDGLASNIIPSMQGFFIHVSNGSYPVAGSLTFTNQARINNLNPLFHKPETATVPLLRFTAGFDGSGGNEDPLVVYFDEASTRNFDRESDALKLLNTDWQVPNIYTITPDASKLSVNSVPPPVDTINVIPVGLKTDKDGWILFNLKDLNNFPDHLFLYFADSRTGICQDLRAKADVRLWLKAGTYDDRFSLIFSLKDLQYKPVNENFFAYSFGETLYIYLRLDPGERSDLAVYNMLGQPVFRRELFINGFEQIPTDLKAGIYVIRLSSSKGFYSKKVFIGNQ